MTSNYAVDYPLAFRQGYQLMPRILQIRNTSLPIIKRQRKNNNNALLMHAGEKEGHKSLHITEIASLEHLV